MCAVSWGRHSAVCPPERRTARGRENRDRIRQCGGRLLGRRGLVVESSLAQKTCRAVAKQGRDETPRLQLCKGRALARIRGSRRQPHHRAAELLWIRNGADGHPRFGRMNCGHSPEPTCQRSCGPNLIEEEFMLSRSPIRAYIPATNVARARKFYEELVGLGRRATP